MEEYIYGRHVLEVLTSGKEHLPEKVYISKTASGPVVKSIISNCREKRIPFNFVPRQKLDFLVKGNHQGVVARASVKNYVELDELMEKSKKGKIPALCLLDEVNDPHNVGAVIRSAAAFGFSGIILPKHRSSGTTDAVMKSSAGALNNIDVCRVTNTSQAIVELKKNDFWIYGADMEGEDVEKVVPATPFVLVVGGEHKGLRHIIKDKCDVVISIKQDRSNIESLNVSVAAGILFYRMAQKITGE